MKAEEFEEFLGSLAEGEFYEDHLLYGEPETEVEGILLCWFLNLRALRKAADEGCNLIVCHETPFYRSPGALDEGDLGEAFQWRANRLKKELLDEHGIVVIRCHRTLDAFCVGDVFLERLGLDNPVVVEEMCGHRAVRILEIEPTPVRELAERWKETFGLPCVRVYTPDLDQPVQLVGSAWGGIGLYTNLQVQARLVELGAELLVGGETDECSIQFCADSGVSFIELGHGTSESPGVRAAADHIANRFPGLKVCFFEEPALHMHF